MIPGVKPHPFPEWLANLKDLRVLPIRKVLRDSLFYPASGGDGDPVRYLGGFVHSFVYVDYGLGKERVLESLRSEQRGFKGYDILLLRDDVTERELCPGGWTPDFPTAEDGTPARYSGTAAVQRPPGLWEAIWGVRGTVQPPFRIWAIFQRRKEFGTDYGPDRFSLIYVGGDGVASFQAMYVANRITPLVVAIIQPGAGPLNMNWTEFTDPEKIFARDVLRNPHGKPRYLLYGCQGRNYRPACWSQYTELIHYWRAAEGELGLWRIAAARAGDKQSVQG